MMFCPASTTARFPRALLAGALLACAPFAAAAQDQAAGKELFMSVAQPSCAVCHTLAAAGAEGKVGPSLDELKPDAERVAKAVKQGVGVMPAFGEQLTEEQIATLARYVAHASGAAK
jgi:sulfite dehydrogenase